MDNVNALIEKKLMDENDYQRQSDIVRYLEDIKFFNSKVKDYKCLSFIVPQLFENYTIRDFVSLDDEYFSKITNIDKKIISKMRKPGIDLLSNIYNFNIYKGQFENTILPLSTTQFKDRASFAKYVLSQMDKSYELYYAGVALYSSDNDIKTYVKTRN